MLDIVTMVIGILELVLDITTVNTGHCTLHSDQKDQIVLHEEQLWYEMAASWVKQSIVLP
jgi:hypothetical protein